MPESDVQQDAEIGEEQARPTPLRAPEEPTAQEREEHRQCNHAVYRSWCKHCCECRGRAWAHASREDEDGATPVISFD